MELHARDWPICMHCWCESMQHALQGVRMLQTASTVALLAYGTCCNYILIRQGASHLENLALFQLHRPDNPLN
jgi:hypothetical protein